MEIRILQVDYYIYSNLVIFHWGFIYFFAQILWNHQIFMSFLYDRKYGSSILVKPMEMLKLCDNSMIMLVLFLLLMFMTFDWFP